MKRYLIGFQLIRLGYILMIIGGIGYFLFNLFNGYGDVADIFNLSDRAEAINVLFD
jgi:hypothetical protein